MENTNEKRLADFWPAMEEQLNSGKTVQFKPNGNSMLPMLRPGVDTVVLKKPPEKLKKYDVPLYIRADGHFVLHRVVRIRDGKYIMCGDNQWRMEYNIRPEQILAVMQGFYRKDKYVSRDNVLYKVYYLVRTAALFLRVYAGVIKRKCLRLLHNKKIKKTSKKVLTKGRRYDNINKLSVRDRSMRKRDLKKIKKFQKRY